VFSGASYHVSEVFVFSEHAGQPITAVERASVLSIGWARYEVLEHLQPLRISALDYFESAKLVKPGKNSFY
jgi:hypothetical protein